MIQPFGVSADTFVMYLEFCILWHKDIRDSSFNSYDYRFKQHQMDLLQSMVGEIDGVGELCVLEEIFAMAKEMEEE